MFEKQFVNYAGKKVIKIHLLSHKILLRWRKRSNRSLHPARNGIIFSDLSIFPFAIGEFPSRRSNIKPSKSSSDCQEVFSAIEKRESFIKKASTLPNLTPTLKRRKKINQKSFNGTRWFGSGGILNWTRNYFEKNIESGEKDLFSLWWEIYSVRLWDSVKHMIF